MKAIPEDLQDCGVEVTNRAPEPKPAPPNFHELSMEYALALADITLLKPQYEAAVSRYKKARDAVKDFVYDRDSEVSVY